MKKRRSRNFKVLIVTLRPHMHGARTRILGRDSLFGKNFVPSLYAYYSNRYNDSIHVCSIRPQTHIFQAWSEDRSHTRRLSQPLTSSELYSERYAFGEVGGNTEEVYHTKQIPAARKVRNQNESTKSEKGTEVCNEPSKYLRTALCT